LPTEIALAENGDPVIGMEEALASAIIVRRDRGRCASQELESGGPRPNMDWP
jgi:hypothetical protein